MSPLASHPAPLVALWMLITGGGGLLLVIALDRVASRRKARKRDARDVTVRELAKLAVNARTSEPRLARHPLGGPPADLGLLPRRSPTSRSRSAPIQRKAKP